MMRHCALTALAVLCLSGGGHVVRGQDNNGPSCSDLGVTDAKSCDKYCGGPSADMMPSSMWLNGATCTCQNCMLRDCKGGSTCFNPPGTPIAPPEPPAPGISSMLPWVASIGGGTSGRQMASLFGVLMLCGAVLGITTVTLKLRKGERGMRGPDERTALLPTPTTVVLQQDISV